jgi:hypothetical protein
MKRQNTVCAEVQNELLRFFDEKSLRRLKPDISAHLNECAKCREEWEALQKLDSELQRLPAADPGETFWINFLPRLRERMERQTFIPRKRDLAWVPAGILALLFAVWLLKQPTPIAPPSWYYAGVEEDQSSSFSLLTDGLTLEDNYGEWNDSLSAADLKAAEIDDIEMKLIDAFSTRTGYVPDDPVDQLLNLDEHSIQKLFQELKERSIIASS